MRGWLTRHQRAVREWLVLLAAVAAGVAGWQQIADERNARKGVEDRILHEEQRSQAEKVSAWIAADSEHGMEAVLTNRSDQPVYQVIVWRVAVYGAGAHTGRELGELSGEDRTFAALPPGRYRTTFDPGFAGMGRKAGVEIAFRDQAGRAWIRRADGILRSIRLSPIEFYGLNEAQAWAIPGVDSRFG